MTSHTVARVLRNKKKQLSPKQLDELRSDVIKVTWEEAQPVLSVVRNSREFRRCQKQLAAHPGPKSRLAPDVLMAATIIAADDGSAWRSVVCQVVNGMDTRLWHQAGLCDHQTRKPVSFGIVARQVERMERLASGRSPQRKEDTMSKDTPRSHTPPGEGMRRLISDILASTVPEKRAERGHRDCHRPDRVPELLSHPRLPKAERH